MHEHGVAAVIARGMTRWRCRRVWTLSGAIKRHIPFLSWVAPASKAEQKDEKPTNNFTPSILPRPNSLNHPIGASEFGAEHDRPRRKRLFLLSLLGMNYVNVAKSLLPFLSKELGDVDTVDVAASFQALKRHQREFRDSKHTRLPGVPACPNTRLNHGLVHGMYHFCRLATAIYGWQGLLFFKLTDPSSSYGLDTVSTFASVPFTTAADVFCSLSGLPKECLVHDSLTAQLGVPRHCVAVDHSSRSIVLIIRGTMSLNDLLTDLQARPTPFGPPGGYAHEGIAHGAKVIYDRTRPVLEEQLRVHPGYGLVLVGHSLGAAAAMLLSIHIHSVKHAQAAALSLPPAQCQPFPGADIHCYAYAPPPVFGPLSVLPAPVASCITAVVHNDDLVPRLSTHSIRRLLDLLRAISQEHPSTWRRFFGFGAVDKKLDGVLARFPEWSAAHAGGKLPQQPTTPSSSSSSSLSSASASAAAGFDGAVEEGGQAQAEATAEHQAQASSGLFHAPYAPVHGVGGRVAERAAGSVCEEGQGQGQGVLSPQATYMGHLADWLLLPPSSTPPPSVAVPPAGGVVDTDAVEEAELSASLTSLRATQAQAQGQGQLTEVSLHDEQRQEQEQGEDSQGTGPQAQASHGPQAVASGAPRPRGSTAAAEGFPLPASPFATGTASGTSTVDQEHGSQSDPELAEYDRLPRLPPGPGRGAALAPLAHEDGSTGGGRPGAGGGTGPLRQVNAVRFQIPGTVYAFRAPIDDLSVTEGMRDTTGSTSKRGEKAGGGAGLGWRWMLPPSRHTHPHPGPGTGTGTGTGSSSGGHAGGGPNGEGQGQGAARVGPRTTAAGLEGRRGSRDDSSVTLPSEAAAAHVAHQSSALQPGGGGGRGGSMGFGESLLLPYRRATNALWRSPTAAASSSSSPASSAASAAASAGAGSGHGGSGMGMGMGVGARNTPGRPVRRVSPGSTALTAADSVLAAEVPLRAEPETQGGGEAGKGKGGVGVGVDLGVGVGAGGDTTRSPPQGARSRGGSTVDEGVGLAPGVSSEASRRAADSRSPPLITLIRDPTRDLGTLPITDNAWRDHVPDMYLFGLRQLLEVADKQLEEEMAREG